MKNQITVGSPRGERQSAEVVTPPHENDALCPMAIMDVLMTMSSWGYRPALA